MNSSKLVVILGPTASGKTSAAANVAYHLGGEIISADSRQVYREMNLGTGKDYNDYIVHGHAVPYHLIDIHDPGYKYNVYEYQQDFLNVFTDIHQRNRMPVLCGGSGLYIEAVTKGYRLLPVPPDPLLRKKLEEKTLPELTKMLSEYRKLHNTTDVDTKKRAIRAIEIEEYYLEHESETNFPEIASCYIGIKFEREKQKKRISDRLQKRLKQGMIEEVDALLKKGISPEDIIYYGLEYKFITLYLLGKISNEEMCRKLEIAIHQFSKRQMTWFRRMERQGTNIHWLNGEASPDCLIRDALQIIEDTEW